MTAPLDLADPVEGGGLLALAARVEALAGPDREVDLAIARHLGLTVLRRNDDDTANYETTFWHYTNSVDHAFSLLDKYGVLLALSDIGADGLPLARVGRPDLDEAPIFIGISSGIAKHATATSGLALALTAAALRARSASLRTSIAIAKGEF